MMMRAHCLGKSIGVTFANETAISFQQKGAVQFDSNHHDWCTICNFDQMYEKVYESIGLIIMEHLWRERGMHMEGIHSLS